MSGYPGAPRSGYPGAPPSSYPGAAPPPGGYGGQPQQHGGYGAPPVGGYRPQHGGYGAPPQGQQYGGQPGYGGVDPQIAQWFNAVDQDRSGQIDAKELQRALVNGNWSNFSEEACRMMIEMFDLNRSGSINVHEFGSLFKYINDWKGLFERIDRDRSGYIEEPEFRQDMFDVNGSGTIDVSEFSQLFGYINNWKNIFATHDKDQSGLIEQSEFTKALEQMGYRFSPTFISNLLAKYDPRGRRLTLDNFIVSNVQIKRLTDSFRTRDREMRGQATFNYEDFIGVALGAHK